MNDAVTYAPTRDSDPARPAGDAALPWADWPVVTRARDVMTRDPDRVAGRLIPPPPNGPPNSGRRRAVPAWRRPDGDGFEVTARAAIAAQPRRVPAAIPGTVRDTRRPATGDHLARPEGVPPSLTPARCATGSSAHRSVRSTEGRR